MLPKEHSLEFWRVILQALDNTHGRSVIDIGGGLGSAILWGSFTHRTVAPFHPLRYRGILEGVDYVNADLRRITLPAQDLSISIDALTYRPLAIARDLIERMVSISQVAIIVVARDHEEVLDQIAADVLYDTTAIPDDCFLARIYCK